jgi:hypothetical protein
MKEKTMTDRRHDADWLLDTLKNATIWPPLNPDPACERCDGTGYSRSMGTVGRCQCNVDSLEAAHDGDPPKAA